MLLIISKVLVVFAYIAIGFIANRLKVLPDESVRYFINLIMEITVPCLMISSITGQELDGNMYVNTIIVFVLTNVSFLILAALCTALADRIYPKMDQQDRNVMAVSMTSCNSGFMGLPVTQAVYGPTIFYYVVIQNISNNLYVFITAVMQLHHREKREAVKRSFREMIKPFTNMASIATLIAVVMLFTGIHLPDSLMEICTTVGNVTIPVSMILVGVQLGGSDFRAILRNKDLLLGSFIRLIVTPALIILLMIPLPIDNGVKLAAALCTCFPSAVTGSVITAKENRNARLAAEMVAATTMLSMITLPVWIVICSSLYL